MTHAEKADRLLALHRGDRPLLLANAWDPGSARLLDWLGFEALATTSSGHAATFGRLDGDVTRDEALAHAADLVAATDKPISADLENGFGAEEDAVAATLRGALATGLAGLSIEDSTGQDDGARIYDRDGGVAHVSVGGAFPFAALGGVIAAARELREHRTYGFWDAAGTGSNAANAAFATTR